MEMTDEILVWEKRVAKRESFRARTDRRRDNIFVRREAENPKTLVAGRDEVRRRRFVRSFVDGMVGFKQGFRF